MADEQIEVKRSVARLLRIFGIVQSREKSNTPTHLPENNIQYGMYEIKELRHIDGLSKKDTKSGNSKYKPEDILSYLSGVSSNTKKTIEDIKNLKVLAPEIKQARQIIISSILSPNDMQTDLVSISTDYPGLSDDVNAEISQLINDYFNDDYKLAPKLVEWYGTAGFEDGAKAILILPQQEVRLLNEVADTWNPNDLDPSCESLCDKKDLEKLLVNDEVYVAAESIIDDMGLESLSDQAEKDKTIKSLVKSNFKLINDNNGCLTVTRDLSIFSKSKTSLEKRVTEYSRKAMQQIAGYDPNSKEQKPAFGVYTVSDVINAEKGDMPLVIEWPADAIIPVCAPRDNKNHIGYFALVDENGQPAQGNYAFGGSFGSQGISKVAYNAAKSVYGNQVMQTFDMNSMSNAQTLEMETKVFSVAINKLITSKLRSDGLTGLDISVHNAVGKSIFFNLLAKNKLRMVFIPEPMLVYFRFDHRDDGTGKSFLEDISFILALRTTLTIAKVMAGIDNATKHRTIEVNVDEQNNNPLETIESVRREFLNKYAPSFTTDPTMAAESILNQHVTITPKSMAGTTEDLSVNVDSKYGNSQAPDGDTMDMLNNWMGIGLMLPPSALNQLAETEYSRSIVVTNLFFSNAVRNWQNIMHPHNNKFVRNYVSCHRGLLDKIRKILRAQGKGTDRSTASNVSPDIDKSDDKVETILKRVVASIDVALPTPNVATSKAHHEEIQAYMDSVQGMVDKIFPDDLAGGDSDASTYLASLRAVIVGNILREFMTKIGFHELASIPTTDEAVMDQVKTTVQFLLNAKRRIENSAKLHKGEAGNGGSEDSGF